MAHDLVIRNGRLVTSAGVLSADLAIRDGRIETVGEDLHAVQEIDASGLLVLPGGVDPHVHLQMPAGETVTSEDWASGTWAAACGGTTTVIDFVEPLAGQSLIEALRLRQEQAAGQAVVDYGLHMTLTSAEDATLAQIGELVKSGVPSFKLYTTYEGFALNDDQLLRALMAIGQAGGMALVHAEKDAIVEKSQAALVQAGQLSPTDYPRSRPPAAEREAIERVIELAQLAATPVYFVHVTTAGGAAAIAHARQQGQVVYGETCPQYLLLDETRYTAADSLEAAGFVCAPPLRTLADQAALWQALADGYLQTLGTDHCAFNKRGQKDFGLKDFRRIPGGLPGVEARLALMYSFGVRFGRISLERWVEVCCEAPARIFGLYPHKGCLLPGADADLVLFDPQKRVIISIALLHEQVDYTPYEGFEVQGWPVKVLLCGKELMNDSQLVNRGAGGCFQIRDTVPDQIPVTNPVWEPR
jgi:dihydropyrimidinase